MTTINRRKDKRHWPLRRDLNDMVRDANGKFSWPKFSVILGQVYSLYLLDFHKYDILDHSDTLLILLMMIIAPHMIIRVLQSKFPVTK
jgi:hypothetical protein